VRPNHACASGTSPSVRTSRGCAGACVRGVRVTVVCLRCVKKAKRSSTGMLWPRGKMCMSCCRSGTAAGMSAKMLGSWSCLRRRADTCTCVPLSPKSAKARAQERPFRTVCTTDVTALMTSGYRTLPSRRARATSSHTSRKRRLYSANTWVSHGCKAHVRPAGMQQKRTCARPKARSARLPMCALYESAKRVKACVAAKGARRSPSSAAICTMVSSVTHAFLHRKRTHGGGTVSTMSAAVCAGIVFSPTMITCGRST
jgi:hypothetical protein